MIHAAWYRIAKVLAGMLLLISHASAQTYYKWTDERGTVHLSDQPPPGRVKVEERVLAPRPGREEHTAVPGEEAQPPAEPGPAQIVIAKQEVERLGANAVHIRGELENTGGSEARGVTVVVKAKDVGQGNPCLEREVTPTRDVLPPKARTTFEAEITDPCLLGEAPVEMSVNWE